MPVAAMAIVAAPSGPVRTIGSAARMPTAMAAFVGVLKVWLTWAHTPPSGSRRSRPIENIIRVVAPWIASVHTNTEARMTNR